MRTAGPKSGSPCRCGVGVSFEACYFEPLSSCSWRDATEGIKGSMPFINSPSQVHSCITAQMDTRNKAGLP